jgi:hypothetical protein
MAWSKVLEKEAAAETELARERALKWLCFLPQGLLRTARRGGDSGKGAVHQRFAALARGDWSKLVDMWKSDVQKSREQDERRGSTRRTRLQVQEIENKRETKELLHLISSGEVGKAVSRAGTPGLASMNDSEVARQMASKYPERYKELPARVVRGRPVQDLKGLREALGKTGRRRAPGTGGLRAEFLHVLAECLQGPYMRLLEDWGLRFLQGELPPWFYVVFLSVQTVPLFKTAQRTGVRPIGMRNTLSKVFNKMMVEENKGDLVAYFEPEQLAMSAGGAAKLVHTCRLSLEKEEQRLEKEEQNHDEEEGEEKAMVKIDVKNAFNCASRHATVTNLEKEDSLQHLAWAAAVQLAPRFALESGGVQWGEGAEGDTQGDPAAFVWFAVSWHPFVRELNATLSAAGGFARFGADDGYCWGPPSVLFPALERFRLQILEHCNLQLEQSKCEVFTWSGRLPREAPRNMSRAGAGVGGRWESGLLVYGVPVGTDSYVSHMLDIKVNELASKAGKLCKVLEGESQSLWSCLRLSLQQQFDYWITLVHPSQVAGAAGRVD